MAGEFRENGRFRVGAQRLALGIHIEAAHLVGREFGDQGSRFGQCHEPLAFGFLKVERPFQTDFRHVAPERCAAYRQDLRPLYERLRPLFESDLAGLADSPLPPE